jgi:hypothetical protein
VANAPDTAGAEKDLGCLIHVTNLQVISDRYDVDRDTGPWVTTSCVLA